jgi:glycosyltransferase involved in cell wall biosynthesis
MQASNTNRCEQVTALIIAKDEEICIETAIQSMQWTNQVIVLDTGSTDRTVAIAKANGATVVYSPFEKFDQSQVRNYALEEIEMGTPWMMILDADEICTPELAEAVKTSVQNYSNDVGLFRLTGKYIFLGRWMKYTMRFPAWHDRLIRIGAGRYQWAIPFEKFICTDGFRVDTIQEPYIHNAFIHGLEHWLDKHVERARSLADEIELIETKNRNKSLKQLFLGKKYNQSVLIHVAIYRLRLGYLAPFLQFAYMYIYRRGFLEGLQGLLLSFLFAIFEAMVTALVAERNLQEAIGKNE